MTPEQKQFIERLKNLQHRLSNWIQGADKMRAGLQDLSDLDQCIALTTQLEKARVESEEIRLIKSLTQLEGTSVTIYYPNPEYTGPSHLISFSADFGATNTRFFGASILECLRMCLQRVERQLND